MTNERQWKDTCYRGGPGPSSSSLILLFPAPSSSGAHITISSKSFSPTSGPLSKENPALHPAHSSVIKKLQNRGRRSCISEETADRGSSWAPQLAASLNPLPQPPNLWPATSTPGEEMEPRLLLSTTAPLTPIVEGLSDPHKVLCCCCVPQN